MYHNIHQLPILPSRLNSDEPTYSYQNMCHVQSKTYACGHSRKSLIKPCTLALCLAPVPHNRAPEFCLNGLTITQTSTSPSPCGRSMTYDSHFSCPDLAILAPLSTRYASARSELSAYAARAGIISSCVDVGIRPEYAWDNVDKNLVDTLQTQQDTYWTETLPMRISWMNDMLVAGAEEVATAFAMGVNGMLGRHVVDVTQDFEVQVNVSCLPVLANEAGAEHLAVQMFAQVYAKVRERVREELQMLEHLALVACLDGVGWRLPVEDMDTVRLLMGRVESREVRPVHGAVEVVRWEEERVHERVYRSGVEEYDVLDTAEVEVSVGVER
jgi:hypothetical protein